MTKIYISSTFADLQEYRASVHRLLTKVPGREIHAMEDYVASDERPVDLCLKDVAACDIYVGIFAWRYGFVPPKDNDASQSITEMEYRRAEGKPRLIFLLDRTAPWTPELMDFDTGAGEGGKRIKALRAELEAAHVVSYFKTPDQLAGLVTAAVTRWEQEQAPAPVAVAAPAPQPSSPVVHFRELRNSLLLAFSPADEELARQVESRCQAWLERPILRSKTALFAQDEAGFAALEKSATQCSGALILLSPTCLDQLKAQSRDVASVLAVVRARTGASGFLLAGVTTAQLPAAWNAAASFEVQAPIPADAALAPVKRWLDDVMPAWNARAVGLPVSVFAMTAGEVQELENDPGIVGNHLGKVVEDRFKKLRDDLTTGGVEWTKRYTARREAWQPFGPGGSDAETTVHGIAREINQHSLPKLRNRQIRIQWYPFDAVLEQARDAAPDLRQRRIYQDMARAGCVLLVDEMSLFHPGLRQALTNSPFFNNDQVAIVTVSPLDPGRAPVDQVLEAEARRQLSGAFTRYANDYDPQCELAVGEERRLRRWLHASLPETVANLREPRPDQGAIRAFFEGELGPGAAGPGGEYPWAGGGQG